MTGQMKEEAFANLQCLGGLNICLPPPPNKIPPRGLGGFFVGWGGEYLALPDIGGCLRRLPTVHNLFQNQS